MAQSYLEDRSLFEALEKDLVEVPLNPSQPCSLKNSNIFVDLVESYSVKRKAVIHVLQNGKLSIAEQNGNPAHFVLSYVHQSATSTYGLAKLLDPAERELVDRIRRRAKMNKSSRVFMCDSIGHYLVCVPETCENRRKFV